eukprot:54019-Chlamydomonas_euryale.AAC.1
MVWQIFQKAVPYKGHSALILSRLGLVNGALCDVCDFTAEGVGVGASGKACVTVTVTMTVTAAATNRKASRLQL